MKKIGMVLLCIFLLWGALPANAAGNDYSIVIHNAVKNCTYQAYKIFDYGVDPASGAYGYTIRTDSEWLGAFGNGSHTAAFVSQGLEFSLSEDGTYYIVREGSGFDPEELAGFLRNHIPSHAPHVSETASGDSVAIQSGESGYYFVTTTLGSLCSLNTTVPVAVIQEKNRIPHIDKKIFASDEGRYAVKTSANVGDTVLFLTTLTHLSLGQGDVILYDEMSDNLSLILDSLQVTNGEQEVTSPDYTVKAPDGTAAFTVTFRQEYLQSLEQEDVLTVSYAARLNETAFGESVNTARLQYDGVFSEWVSASVENYSMDIVKINEAKTIVQGASFLLYDSLTGGNVIPVVKLSEGEYRPAVDGEQGEVITAGKATVHGLGKQILYLEEVTAPNGYSKLTQRAAIAVQGDMEAETEEQTYLSGGAAVVNRVSGSLLPAAGGVGVTFLTVTGLGIIAISVVMFVRKSRRVEYEKE